MTNSTDSKKSLAQMLSEDLAESIELAEEMAYRASEGVSRMVEEIEAVGFIQTA